MKTLHDIFLWIHIPAGTISLILFWIPVLVQKGGNVHRKVGKAYYLFMWMVLITSFLLSCTNFMMEQYEAAVFLGFLGVLTGYPLWYSYEILHQKKEWTASYYKRRKGFAWILFCCAIGMLLGAIAMKFQGAGVLMFFFGTLGMPAYRDARMTKEIAMAKEGKLEMHIKGTIISGAAAYTAFFAFGGRAFFGDFLTGYLQIIPWILPSIIGLSVIKFMKKKYKL